MLRIIGLILLWILRIIGIILGLILMILLLILFVPFRYKAKGDLDEGVDVEVEFSWLFHFINGYYVKKGDFTETVARITVFKVYKSGGEEPEEDKKPVKDKKAKPKKDKQKADKQKAELTKPKEEASTIVELEEETKPEESGIKEEIKSEIKESIKEEQKKESKSEEAEKEKVKKEKKAKKEKKEKEENPNIEKAKNLWKFLHEPENEGVLKFVIKYVGKVLKWLLPRKGEADMEIGLEDPALTGYIAGAAGILDVRTKGKIHLRPDFNEQVIKGQFIIKGRLYLYQLVYYIIRVILDKRVRRLIKEVRG